LGRRPLDAILHSSNEPGELSQWLCHDDSTINIVLDIIIIIISTLAQYAAACVDRRRVMPLYHAAVDRVDHR